MKKRIALAVMAAVLLALVVVPVAQAAITVGARDTSATIPTMKRTVWRVWVRGLNNSKSVYLNEKSFKALRAGSGTTWTDTASGEVFGGVDLKALVGLVDDRNPKTFNQALAAANSYQVNVAGADGWNYSFASADVATKNIVVANGVAASATAVETSLPLGTAKYKSSKDTVSFSPNWPLKLVGTDLASGSQKIGGINLICLLPVTTTK